MSTENPNENNIHSAIRWWERKRLIYNVVVLIVCLIKIFVFKDYLTDYSMFGYFLFLIIWMFGANLFYTLSWVTEVLANYYLKGTFWDWNLRIVLFSIGTVIALIWTYSAFLFFT